MYSLRLIIKKPKVAIFCVKVDIFIIGNLVQHGIRAHKNCKTVDKKQYNNTH